MNDYTNSEYVFETLLRDYNFMNSIDDYIVKNIQINKTFYSKNVPQLVLIILTLLLDKKRYIDSKNNIKNDNELQQLLDLFYAYALTKIKECISITNSINEPTVFNGEEFKLVYDICCRLVLFKFNYSNKTGFLCFK